MADVSSEFRFANDGAISQALTSSGLSTTLDPKADRDKLFRVLANTICSGRYAYLASNLERSGVAVFSGSCDQQSKLVVIIGGASAETQNLAQNVDAQLIACFEKLGVTVVGCETSAVAISYVPVWHKAGIATVDNAENAIGQTCLVYALNGEMANFGTKDTADRFIPKSMENF